MIVVADTSPISYLILIDEIEILPNCMAKSLFHRPYLTNSFRMALRQKFGT